MTSHPRRRILGGHWKGWKTSNDTEEQRFMGALHLTPKQALNEDRQTALQDGDASLLPRKRDLFLRLWTGPTVAHILKKIRHQLMTQSPPCLQCFWNSFRILQLDEVLWSKLSFRITIFYTVHPPRTLAYSISEICNALKTLEKPYIKKTTESCISHKHLATDLLLKHVWTSHWRAGNADKLESTPDVAGRPGDPCASHLLGNLQPSHLLILGTSSPPGSWTKSEVKTLGAMEEAVKVGGSAGRTLNIPSP